MLWINARKISVHRENKSWYDEIMKKQRITIVVEAHDHQRLEAEATKAQITIQAYIRAQLGCQAVAPPGGARGGGRPRTRGASELDLIDALQRAVRARAERMTDDLSSRE